MWNRKKLWRPTTVAAAALLGVYLASTIGGTAAKGAGLNQSVPAPSVDETAKIAGTETLILAGVLLGSSGCVPTRARRH